MTRGFVTVATGKESYYKLANNLLHSYRYFTKSPMPFAIICDQKNEYSNEFDDVILIEKPTFSTVDKLQILKCSPYDETIFIESDCLAYYDLNIMWGGTLRTVMISAQ